MVANVTFCAFFTLGDEGACDTQLFRERGVEGEDGIAGERGYRS